MRSHPKVIIVQSSWKHDLIIKFGPLQFVRENIIGMGGYGTVFAGTFNGQRVAVKRVQHLDDVKNREQENNKKLSRLNHPNIVQFKHYEEDETFR